MPVFELRKDAIILFHDTVNAMFFKMPYFIGIPQIILNAIVLCTVILIIQHPSIAMKKQSANERRQKYLIPR